MASPTPGRAGSLRVLGRKIAQTEATVAATGALTDYATDVASTYDHDPFARSVTAPVEPGTRGPG